MFEKCDNTNNGNFCPYCGHELPNEDNTVVTQETFDAIFRGMLRKANTVVWLDDAGNKSDIPTCNFDLRDDNGVWMFYISLNPTSPTFWFSYLRVYKFFNENYGLETGDIQLLMKHQLKRIFNMNGVTPLYGYKRGAFLLQRVFKMDGVTPIDEVGRGPRALK